MSNFITHVAKGDTAVSVSMTAISTAASVVMTPLNLAIWGSIHPTAREVLRSIRLDPVELFVTIVIILGIPLVVGMLFAAYLPRVADKLRKPFKVGSLLFFAAFLAIAFKQNFEFFLAFIGMVFVPVLLQNAMALGTGYGLAWVVRLREAQRRAVSIEVGIQNSALALVLIFEFFEGLGGMAIIAGWWGVWHIIAGLSVAGFWSRFPVTGRSAEAEP